MKTMTVRDLINELVKYDPRIEVRINDKPIIKFELEKFQQGEYNAEKLNIKG